MAGQATNTTGKREAFQYVMTRSDLHVSEHPQLSTPTDFKQPKTTTPKAKNFTYSKTPGNDWITDVERGAIQFDNEALSQIEIESTNSREADARARLETALKNKTKTGPEISAIATLFIRHYSQAPAILIQKLLLQALSSIDEKIDEPTLQFPKGPNTFKSFYFDPNNKIIYYQIYTENLTYLNVNDEEAPTKKLTYSIEALFKLTHAGFRLERISTNSKFLKNLIVVKAPHILWEITGTLLLREAWINFKNARGVAAKSGHGILVVLHTAFALCTLGFSLIKAFVLFNQKCIKGLSDVAEKKYKDYEKQAESTDRMTYMPLWQLAHYICKRLFLLLRQITQPLVAANAAYAYIAARFSKRVAQCAYAASLLLSALLIASIMVFVLPYIAPVLAVMSVLCLLSKISFVSTVTLAVFQPIAAKIQVAFSFLSQHIGINRLWNFLMNAIGQTQLTSNGLALTTNTAPAAIVSTLPVAHIAAGGLGAAENRFFKPEKPYKEIPKEHFVEHASPAAAKKT